MTTAMHARVALLAGVGALIFSVVAPARVSAADDSLVVDSRADDADASPNDDECESAAGECTLRAAVASAGEREIVLSAGTFEVGSPLTVETALRITGAGKDKTIIDFGTGSQGFDVRRAGLTLRDLTVRGGRTEGNGAAIIIDRAPLVLRDVVMSGASAGGDGGAIAAVGAKVSIESSSFEDNTARSGGALFAQESEVTVADSTFARNGARDGGGAILVSFPQGVSITGSTFTENLATVGAGGAVFAQGNGGSIGNALVVDTSVFRENSASNEGGALFTLGMPLELRETELRSNNASTGGGLYAGDTAIIDQARFEGNTSVGDGGAIAAFGDTTITETAFVGNASDASGGALAAFGSVTQGHSNTFDANRAELGAPDVLGQIDPVTPSADGGAAASADVDGDGDDDGDGSSSTTRTTAGVVAAALVVAVLVLAVRRLRPRRARTSVPPSG